MPGRAILIGSAPDNLDRYVRNFDVSGGGQDLGQPSTITQTGAVAYNNSYSASSVIAFGEFSNSQPRTCKARTGNLL